jgi:hypothetical protein
MDTHWYLNGLVSTAHEGSKSSCQKQTLSASGNRALEIQIHMDGYGVNQGLAKRANGAVAELGNDPHRRIDSVTRRIGS